LLIQFPKEEPISLPPLVGCRWFFVDVKISFCILSHPTAHAQLIYNQSTNDLDLGSQQQHDRHNGHSHLEHGSACHDPSAVRSDKQLRASHNTGFDAAHCAFSKSQRVDGEHGISLAVALEGRGTLAGHQQRLDDHDASRASYGKRDAKQRNGGLRRLQQFIAQVKNTTNSNVSWSTSTGSITPSGMFSAPIVTSDGTATIVATSVADPSKSATAVFTVKAPIQHSVSLNWWASPSSNVVFYNAYRASTHGGPYALTASAITGLAYSDMAVQAGTTYYYVVTATNDRGQESIESGEVSASVPSP